VINGYLPNQDPKTKHMINTRSKPKPCESSTNQNTISPYKKLLFGEHDMYYKRSYVNKNSKKTMSSVKNIETLKQNNLSRNSHILTREDGHVPGSSSTNYLTINRSHRKKKGHTT